MGATLNARGSMCGARRGRWTLTARARRKSAQPPARWRALVMVGLALLSGCAAPPVVVRADAPEVAAAVRELRAELARENEAVSSLQRSVMALAVAVAGSTQGDAAANDPLALLQQQIADMRLLLEQLRGEIDALPDSGTPPVR